MISNRHLLKSGMKWARHICAAQIVVQDFIASTVFKTQAVDAHTLKNANISTEWRRIMSEIYTPTVDWMIFFEDTEHDPMVFTDEDCARKAYEMKAQNWNCHLFYRVSSEAGIDYPKAEIQQ